MWTSRRFRVVTLAVAAALAVTAGAVLAGEDDRPDPVTYRDVVLPASDPAGTPETTTTMLSPSGSATAAGASGTTSSTQPRSTTSSTGPSSSPATVATTSTTIPTVPQLPRSGGPTPTFPPQSPADSEVALACSPDVVTIPEDQPATVSCTATSVKGYFGWVTFLCSPSDSAVVCSREATGFNVAAGESLTVALRLESRQPYRPDGQAVSVTVTASYRPGGSTLKSRTATVSARIPGLSVACTPVEITYSYYGPTVIDCTVTAAHGFAGVVTPECSGDARLSCTSDPAWVTVPENGTATFQLTIGLNPVQRGTYEFHVGVAEMSTYLTQYRLYA